MSECLLTARATLAERSDRLIKVCRTLAASMMVFGELGGAGKSSVYGRENDPAVERGKSKKANFDLLAQVLRFHRGRNDGDCKSPCELFKKSITECYSKFISGKTIKKKPLGNNLLN
jgi:hypothetical protein